MTPGHGEASRWASIPGDAADVSFGRLLRALRRDAGLSQRQLAERIGTTQSAIARLEAGRTEPKIATLTRLADALGCDLTLSVAGRR
jgi:transcriptional regulator with XRE-family HTH domain